MAGMSLPTLPPSVKRPIGLIVVHCSATPSGQWLGGVPPGRSGYKTAPAVIDAWHAQRGFKRGDAARAAFNYRLPSIGYHFVVDLDGMVWTGRSLEEIGAHVAGRNANSIGICLVGGAEREGRYTVAQWASLAELVKALADRLQVPLHTRDGWRAGKGVCGHRDLSPDTNGNGTVEPREWLKTCPGFDVQTWLSRGLLPLDAHVLQTAVPE